MNNILQVIIFFLCNCICIASENITIIQSEKNHNIEINNITIQYEENRININKQYIEVYIDNTAQILIGLCDKNNANSFLYRIVRPLLCYFSCLPYSNFDGGIRISLPNKSYNIMQSLNAIYDQSNENEDHFSAPIILTFLGKIEGIFVERFPFLYKKPEHEQKFLLYDEYMLVIMDEKARTKQNLYKKKQKVEKLLNLTREQLYLMQKFKKFHIAMHKFIANNSDDDIYKMFYIIGYTQKLISVPSFLRLWLNNEHDIKLDQYISNLMMVQEILKKI